MEGADGFIPGAAAVVENLDHGLFSLCLERIPADLAALTRVTLRLQRWDNFIAILNVRKKFLLNFSLPPGNEFKDVENN